jgi:long-subunit acyl-CoA synthetase (AMP-forming)
MLLGRCGQLSKGTSSRHGRSAVERLSVSIEEGEIVVDGPSITDGYLGQRPANRPWCTGDLGEIDRDGLVTIHERKDSVLVTSFGRNISPEWIETMLLADPRVALCIVTGHGEPHLTVLFIPSRQRRALAVPEYMAWTNQPGYSSKPSA